MSWSVCTRAKLCHAANGSRFETRPSLQFSAKKAPGNEIPVWPKSFQREVEFIGGLKKNLTGVVGKPPAESSIFGLKNLSNNLPGKPAYSVDFHRHVGCN